MTGRKLRRVTHFYTLRKFQLIWRICREMLVLMLSRLNMRLRLYSFRILRVWNYWRRNKRLRIIYQRRFCNWSKSTRSVWKCKISCLSVILETNKQLMTRLRNFKLRSINWQTKRINYKQDWISSLLHSINWVEKEM